MAVPAPTADAEAADPVVTAIRAKLTDQAVVKDANENDVAASSPSLEREAARHLGHRHGLHTRAQSALFEIEKAEDWGSQPRRSHCRPPARCREARTSKLRPRLI